MTAFQGATFPTSTSKPTNWLEALAQWVKDAKPIPPELGFTPKARTLRGRRRAVEKFSMQALPYRDQTMTIRAFPARLTKAHRRGNVTPILINPRRRVKYAHSSARRTYEFKQAA